MQSQINAYLARFSLARQLSRQHHFYLGPTNSGKTYHALQTLMQAPSGVYLAPLRLLAMEVRDKLMAAGVPCNLVTGEERILVDGARHTASTIEMMHPQRAVDVAVIDEIQMLLDPDRGSAWTNALVGVPASRIFVCGSNAVTTACTALLDALNEPYQIAYLERMTPLEVEEASICGAKYHPAKLRKALQTGDAIVAFSRKDVLTLAARIRQWGFSVATIYGALAPEVRRVESERFSTGAAQILVATDAIGMGLNLPIRRVIFASMHKFDGVAARPLNATEVRQIAGRAGRHGMYPTGYVTAMEDDEQWHLLHMLQTDDRVDLTHLPVGLSLEDVETLSQRLPTWRIAECVEHWQQTALGGQQTSYLGASYEAVELKYQNVQYQQALLVDEIAPTMQMRDKFTLICAPLSIQVPISRDYFSLCVQSIYLQQTRALPKLPNWVQSDNPQHLETAEQLSQQLSLYAWLAFKYPQIFVEAADIPQYRASLSAYIVKALASQAGYTKTQREAQLSVG